MHLTRTLLQAPALRYLPLGGCSTPSGWLSSAADWTLLTPALKALSLQGCAIPARFKIDSLLLETLDARSASVNLSWLKAFRTPEQWASMRRMQLSESGPLSQWSWLGDYPFLAPLAEEWMSVSQLLALHTLFSRSDVAASLTQLPTAGRWRLQLGLTLFFW